MTWPDAAAAHAGFSLVVTVVVYPALADRPDDDWPRRHADHSRRIGLVVAPLYLAVAAACGWVLLTGPQGWQWVALGGNAAAALTTATMAAPTHSRLGRAGPRPELLARLLRVDRLRTAGAVVALVGALLG